MSAEKTKPGDIAILAFWILVLGLIIGWAPIKASYEYHKITCGDQSIPFESSSQDDPNTTIGTRSITTIGQNGVKHVCSRGDGTTVSSEVSRPAVSEVVAVGSKITPLYTHAAQTTYGTLCSDGWVSSSTGRGTCSHHGGIAY